MRQSLNCQLRVMFEKNVGMIELDPWRNASGQPVVDALSTAILVKTEQFSDFRRST